MTTEPKDERGGDFRPCENEPKTPSDPPPVREAVARIIDPEVFADLAAVQKAGGPWFYGYSGQTRLNDALAKADAILALTGETSRE